MAEPLKDIIELELAARPSPDKGLSLDSRGKIDYNLLVDPANDGDMLRYTTATGWAATSSVQNVTAISAATTFDGAIAKVRAGSTPFDFMLLMYDSTYAKWVSIDTTHHFMGGVPDSSLAVNDTYVVVAFTHGGVHGLLEWEVLDDAGLKPQFKVGGICAADTLNDTVTLALTIRDDDEDVAQGSDTAKFAETVFTAPSNTAGATMSDFTDHPSLTAKNYVGFIGWAKASDVTGTNTVATMWCDIRWVSK